MSADQDHATGVRPVKSASRTIEVLEYLSSRQASPASLADVHRFLHAPRSSTYALLRTLVDHGWVQQVGDGYSLGIRALITGTAYIDSDPHVRIVRPLLTDLASTLNETFHLGRIDGPAIVYLVTQESARDARVYSRVGRRLPSTVTSLGKAILAYRPELTPTTLTALTEHSITDPQKFSAEMERTRRRGYATDNEENTIGIRCIAMALPYTTPVTDAISCSIPIARWTQEYQDYIRDSMRRAVSRALESAPLDPSHPSVNL